jgi:hypothetical protein
MSDVLIQSSLVVALEGKKNTSFERRPIPPNERQAFMLCRQRFSLGGLSKD